MDDRMFIRPRARLDVVELATYLGRDSATTASRFLDACDAIFKLLTDSPQIGGFYSSQNQRLAGLRVFRVKGFPNHLVFYLEQNGKIEIVRVLHGARDLDVALQDE
jgi:toxin ParE1/3/4